MAITKISAAMADLDGAVTINESSGDADFRVESDGNTRAISILGDKYGLGVGRDPESAYNGYASVELGQQGAILANEAGDDFWFGSNVYLDGSGNSTRKEAGVAALLQIDGDVISWYTAGSGSADTTISWSMKNRFSNDGNLSFNSGQGIDFSATGDGSGTDSSELLDDYEEGSWTPTIGTGTFSTSDAYYVKVGRFVKFSFRANTFNDITTNTSIAIGGLPYPVETNQALGSVMGIQTDNTDADTSYANTSETLYFYSLSSGGWDAMTHADLNLSSADFYVQGSYRTEY